MCSNTPWHIMSVSAISITHPPPPTLTPARHPLMSLIHDVSHMMSRIHDVAPYTLHLLFASRDAGASRFMTSVIHDIVNWSPSVITSR